MYLLYQTIVSTAVSKAHLQGHNDTWVAIGDGPTPQMHTEAVCTQSSVSQQADSRKQLLSYITHRIYLVRI